MIVSVLLGDVQKNVHTGQIMLNVQAYKLSYNKLISAGCHLQSTIRQNPDDLTCPTLMFANIVCYHVITLVCFVL